MKFEIPEPQRLNHKKLRVALQRASMAGGKISAAARKLAILLQPDLMKEEKDLLPTLGALLPIAKGEITADADTADLFTEISRGIDKWLWFVEVHSQATK
jgi:DNA-binding ferritin-like protein